MEVCPRIKPSCLLQTLTPVIEAKNGFGLHRADVSLEHFLQAWKVSLLHLATCTSQLRYRELRLIIETVLPGLPSTVQGRRSLCKAFNAFPVPTNLRFPWLQDRSICCNVHLCRHSHRNNPSNNLCMSTHQEGLDTYRTW